MSHEEDAEAIIAGTKELPFDKLKVLADALRDERRGDLAGATLTAVGRRALLGEWRRHERAQLAELLRDHQQFGYGRRLLARVRSDGQDTERLRQQHALCTYKDLELAVRRLDRRAADPDRGRLVAACTSAETLGCWGPNNTSGRSTSSAETEERLMVLRARLRAGVRPAPRVPARQRRRRLRSSSWRWRSRRLSARR